MNTSVCLSNSTSPTRWPRLLRVALIVNANILLLVAVRAQAFRPDGVASGSESLPVLISSEAGKSIETKIEYGDALPIGLRANQKVRVSVQFPTERAGEPIPVSVWDGGKISTANNDALIGGDGRLTFAFQAGSAPGLYRVVLQPSSEEYCVRFWVVNERTPEKKPRLSLAE